jgi:uncharacterized protein (TIGR03437 family)
MVRLFPFILALIAPVYAGLLGTEVTVTELTMTTTTSTGAGPENFLVGTQNLNCPQVDYSAPYFCVPGLGVPYSIVFTDNQIIYTSTNAYDGGDSYYPAIFNGWQFTNLNMGAPITGVGLLTSGLEGLPVVTFTANSVSINLQGILTLGAVSFTLTLQTAQVNLSSTGPVNFAQAQGGPAPQAQNLILTGSFGGGNYSATVVPGTGGNWLQINGGTSASGSVQTTANLALSVNPAVANSLAAGQYTSQISFSFPGTGSANATVTVGLTVAAAPLNASPPSLTFAYSGGVVSPGSQTINVTGGGVGFNVAATSAGNWLTAEASGASTPATVNVSVNPASLPSVFPASGLLTGSVTISAPSGSITIPVTITGPAAPQPSTIQNSASLGFGPIAPGELITIQGANLGPATPASFTVDSQGHVASLLSGVQVMFDSFAGIPTYVSSTQINVAVPYEIAGQTTTKLSVVYGGQTSVQFTEVVAPVAPAIFTFSANGQGQAIVQNVTGVTAGTTNGPAAGIPVGGVTVAASPASQGAVISVYATGGGVTNPPAATGSVNSIITLQPLLNWTPTSGTVTATIGGVTANVSFAGAAPGLVDGIYQFDIAVPVGVSGDALPLVITVDGVSSPAGPTVAVQ